MRISPAISFTSILFLAACGSGGGGGGGDTGSAAGSGDTLGGTSSKGIIQGGVVNAYGFTDGGEINRAVRIANQTITASDGSYQLALNENYQRGSAVLVEITASAGDAPSMMICDLSVCQRDGSGNPTVSFGDVYPLNSNFKMSSLVPDPTGNTVANITPLTSAAAEIGIDRIANGAAPKAAAEAANTQVIDRLALPAGAKLTELPIVNIVDTAAVSAASAETLEYNLKAAAVVQAALSAAGNGAPVEDALRNFTEQFADRGVADNEGGFDTADVSMQEVLQEARKLVDTIQDSGEVDSTELHDTDLSLGNEALAAERSDNVTPSQGTAPSEVDADGVTAARSLVAQLRSLFIENGALTQGQNPFQSQLDLVDNSLNTDMMLVTEATTKALTAMAAAAEAHRHDESIADYSIGGIVVTIGNDFSTGGALYQVNQTLSMRDDRNDNDTSVFVSVSGVNADTINQTANGNDFLALQISGQAASNAASLSISGAATLRSSGFFNSESSLSSATDQAAIALEMPVSLSLYPATAGATRTSFNGEMTVHLARIVLARDSQQSTEPGTIEHFAASHRDNFMAERVEIALAGSFTDDAGTGLDASVTAAFNLGDEATEGDFSNTSLSLIFDSAVSGIAGDVAVELLSTQTGLNSGQLAMSLSFDGTRLNMEYNGADNTLYVVNHAGVVLSVSDIGSSAASGERIIRGAIHRDGVRYATIDQQRGFTAVNYSDGEFEALD